MVVPNMSDGRAFTDYRQNCQMMADFRKDTGVHDPKNVRLMMQQQADQIMQNNSSGSNNCSRFEANGKTAMCEFKGDSLTATSFALPVSLDARDPHFTPAPLENNVPQREPQREPQRRPVQKAPVQKTNKPNFTPPTSTFLSTASPSPFPM